MSIRKRKWIGPGGEEKSAWVVDFKDLGGNRRLKTFRLKKEADRYATKVRAELLYAELKAKGPAEAATSPSRGSTIPAKDMKMNTDTNTTAASAAPAQDVRDLETPIADAERMASILSRMIADTIGGPPNGPDVFRITRTQREDILFAAYHTEDLIRRIFTKLEALA